MEDANSNAIKTQRACVGCRKMKIKCVRKPRSTECEMCLRYFRPCELPGPVKPRIRSSQKFSELEAKIESLTKALDSRTVPSPQNDSTLDTWEVAADGGATQNPGILRYMTSTNGSSNRVEQRVPLHNPTGDAIERGLLDNPTALLLFDYWKQVVHPLLPIIDLGQVDDMFSVRQQKPTLFLTILTIASGAVRPNLVPPLLEQLNYMHAQNIHVLGAKSIDLLQSIILFAHYHIAPPDVKTFPLTQHPYTALIMASDLGIEGKMLPKGNETDPESLGKARLMLGIYLAVSCSTIFLRRQSMRLNATIYEHYVTVLEDSKSRDTDAWLCSLVSLQRIVEDAYLTFTEPNNDDAGISFDDTKAVNLSEFLRNRLAKWDQKHVNLVDARLKKLALLSAQLYVHKVGVRAYSQMITAAYKVQSQGGGFRFPDLTANHFQALSHNLDLCRIIIETYISLEDHLVRALPNVFLLWCMYAVVVLLKLGSFAEKLPSFHGLYGQDRDSIAQLIDMLIRKVSVHTMNGFLPQARPFELVFRKMRLWYMQKKEFCMKENQCTEESEPVPSVFNDAVDPTVERLYPLPSLPPQPEQIYDTQEGNDTWSTQLSMEAPDNMVDSFLVGNNVDIGNNGMFLTPEEIKDLDFSILYDDYLWTGSFA